MADGSGGEDSGTGDMGLACNLPSCPMARDGMQSTTSAHTQKIAQNEGRTIRPALYSFGVKP
jgi:hypothetical protein